MKKKKEKEKRSQMHMDIMCLLMLVNFQAKVNTDSAFYTHTISAQVKPYLNHC